MKYFVDFYGCTASIKTNRDGTATLAVSSAWKRILKKTYSSERGARIAMSKMGDCWRERK